VDFDSSSPEPRCLTDEPGWGLIVFKTMMIAEGISDFQTLLISLPRAEEKI
jgi:hypothetical protein